MAEGGSLYLVDCDSASRRQMARQLGERGFDVWPFLAPGELLDLLPRLRPSPLLVGVRRGDSNIALIEDLCGRGFEWPIIAYSGDADVPTAVAAMRHGAIDFLEMPVDRARLELALRAAEDRLERVTSMGAAAEDARSRLARLTAREREVAAALLSGSCNKRVAHILGISVRTAEMHRAHLMAKLEVRNIAEAAVLLARTGFPDSSIHAPRLASAA
jgi:two-component system response regulator FixJ